LSPDSVFFIGLPQQFWAFVQPFLLLFSCGAFVFVAQRQGIDVVIAGSTAFAVCSILMATVYFRDVYRYILTENAMSVIRHAFFAEYLTPLPNGTETRMAVKLGFRESGGSLQSNDYQE
jgi:hypothetical protein